MSGKKLKVVLIGGLSNGKVVYEYLKSNRYADVKKVITYSDNIEKPRFTKFENNKNVIKDTNANNYYEEIKEIQPDIIFVAGWSELLSKELIDIPPMGTIGFHPAKLPEDRGRSVLAWQIEEGYTETALSMFYFTEIPDGGDIIAQETIKIEFNDYINNVLEKVDKATDNIMKNYFPLLGKGIAPRKKQNHKEASFRRLRNNKDSLIDWSQNAVNVYNKIRAISKPYPGTDFVRNGQKIKVWEANIVNNEFADQKNVLSKPGDVVAAFEGNKYWIKCRDKILEIICNHQLKVGENLE